MIKLPGLNRPKYFFPIFLYFLFSFLFSKNVFAKDFTINPDDTSSLISAIAEANNNNELDVINLATSSSYLLTEINNSVYSNTGLPLITTEIVINGNGAKIYRESASDRFRIFAIQNPGKLTLTDVIINGGFSDDNNIGGGGILNFDGVLIINNSLISNNTALIGGGAGIWAQSGSSYIFNTTISENNSGNHGETISSGGAFVKRGLGLFKVTNSFILNNEAETIGGAIYSNATSSGEIIIENSSLLNNSTRLQGGAIYNYQGKISITNSCISGNVPNAVINETVSPFIISAINNWWGHENGPSGAGGGSGDYIGNRIDYIPFLVLASCPPLASPSPTPTPTPTPAPTPTPTPTPTPEPTKIPVVILPGLGASWNTTAMITGGTGGSWKKTPFIKVYDNLKETFLANAGYTENDNYFEYYYDWRRPLDHAADTFKDYLSNTVLNNKPVDTKVDLVGHSMGGMVARTYAQKYGLDKINKIVTTGSPHEGAIKVWQGWSGAEIGNRWSWEWIGLDLYLQIHKGLYNSPVNALRDLVPGLIDLSPIFDFAKNNNNQIINVSSMSFVNDYLVVLKNSISADLKNLMTTIGGLEQDNDRNSVEWIKLTDRSLADRLLGKWADGKPSGYEYTTDGDLTVLKKSAQLEGAAMAMVNANHIELVETEAGIQAILDALEVSASPSTNNPDIPRNPSLVFFLHSPAKIKVTAPDNSQAGADVAAPMANSLYSPEDKLLVIYNAIAGDYEVTVTGTGNGSYQLEIGQLTIDGEKWSNTANSITTGQTDNYRLSFNPDQPENNPLSTENVQTYLELAKFRLFQLQTNINQLSISLRNKRNQLVYIKQTIRLIDRALLYAKANNLTLAAKYIQAAIETNYSLRQRAAQVSEINSAGEWLIKAFLKADSLSLKPINKILAGRHLSLADKLHNQIVIQINANINGENLIIGEILNLEEEFLNQAHTSNSLNQSAETYIYSLVSRILSYEAKQKI